MLQRALEGLWSPAGSGVQRALEGHWRVFAGWFYQRRVGVAFHLAFHFRLW